MFELTFTTEEKYRFARACFGIDSNHSLAWNPTTLTTTLKDEAVSKLFDRVNMEKAVILPRFGKDVDRWLITARSATEIDQIVMRVKGFLYPSYVRFGEPRWQRFHDDRTEIGRFGHLLYGTGYYTLESAVSNRQQILQQLDRWMILENAKPTLATIVRLTYSNIITEFEYALTAADWKKAAGLIQTARKNHLTTAENITFLQYRLLAQQSLWAAIFTNEQFENLTHISLPRQIKEIMLRAFHNQLIAPREAVSWKDGYKAFADNLNLVSNLLVSRSELTSDSVLKLFAYQAVEQRDAELLQELINLSDGLLQEQLEQIRKLLTNPKLKEPELTELTLVEQVHQHLHQNRFDHAWQLALQIETRKERTPLLLQIAMFCHDSEREEQAFNEFQKCSDKHQLEIVTKLPYLRYFLETQKRLHQERETDATNQLQIHTWQDWLSAVHQNPSHPGLTNSLEQLFTHQKLETYDIAQLELFYTMLLDLSEPRLQSKPYVNTFIKKLATRLVDDALFPQDHAAFVELYEGLFESVMSLGFNKGNLAILMRLLEGILREKPSMVTQYLDLMKQYVTHYSSTTLPQMLELFEIFTARGAKHMQINPWLNDILAKLLQQRQTVDLYSLLVWEELATWAYCRDDFIQRLKNLQATQEESDEESLIPKLTKGYKILIFMLNESTAKRIKRYIEMLNPEVDVALWTQKTASADIKRSAPLADMVVMVTACIKHAISEAIEPITPKEKRVYPGKSQGSSAIIRAIENHLAGVV